MGRRHDTSADDESADDTAEVTVAATGADVDAAPLDAATTTLRLVGVGADAHALVPPMHLRVITGPDAGARFAADSDRITIGTHERADVLLRDRAVSRFHCEIALEGARFVIRDLDSRNGTFIDGVAVLAAPIRSGATVRVGRSELRFDIGDAPLAMSVSSDPSFGNLVGESAAMRAVFARLARAAASEATVLLTGETGTGKEAAAESIHRAGARAQRPFVVIDCAAIPSELLESELFGHEKGAFTGASSARAGAFEIADGGTIFLDEIGELPMALQPKLLRVLEKREIKRVGSSRYQPIDVRIIAATNRDLRAGVNAQRFRSDLYYRLAVLQIKQPPLRERIEDLPRLVERLLVTIGLADHPDAALVRTATARAEMARHPWPGNVRELRNYVERCLALAERAPLDESAAGEGGADAEEVAADAGDLRAARRRWTSGFEKSFLEELLQRHGGNVSAAARTAGVDRKYFYKLLWRHGLR